MSGQDHEHKFPQRLGNQMIVIAWILGLGMLTWFFGHYLDRQHNPNEDVMSSSHSGSTEVLLERNREGHYVASGRINGRPVTFMLDTGATMVSVPGRLADKLSLARGPMMQVTTANGNIPVYSTILDEVQLGGIVLRNIRASINPYMDDDDILLGMSFLKQLDFSQEGNTLTLRQPASPR